MLTSVERRDDGFRPIAASHHVITGEQFDFESALAAARRQLLVVAVCCALGLGLGVAYLATTVPQYTATALLLLDHKRLRALEDNYDVMAQGADVAVSAIDSQAEVIKSDNVALSVVNKLQLTKDPEFTSTKQGMPNPLRVIWREFWNRITPPPPAEAGNGVPQDAEAEKRRAIANSLLGSVDIRRVPRTLVLELSYTSSSPEKAAILANAFAEAYLTDQLDAKYEATRRAGGWLEDRMAELKQQVLTTDLAVQRFKASNDLIGSGGKLVNEQQLGEVNSQLVLARTETARAEARYERIKTILENHQTDAVVTEAIGNTVIEQLRSRFVAAAKRESELLDKLGPTHGSVVNLRMEMREYERLMFEELNRIAEVYRSELDIARSREKALRESLEGLVGSTASSNETLVALRELEREAESYRSLYQSFLQRYQQVVQNQSFPITDARVIKSAQKPAGPSRPRKLPVLALALMFGAGLGICVGVLREMRERTFRTGEQVRSDLGLEFLGMLPMIPEKEKKQKAKAKAKQDLDPTKQHLQTPPSIMRRVLDHPLSGFAETLRAVKIAADLTLPNRTPKVIGVVSVLPGEGKSTVAKNLGSLLAHLGTKTLLIDADLRNPGMTRSLAPDAKAGIVDAVLKGKPIADLLLYEPDSNAALLPAVVTNRLTHTSELLSSPGMKAVMHQAMQEFSCIVVDLPPMGAVVDARAMAPQIDAFLMVVGWGSTARRLVRTTLESEPQIREKCLGVVLNKVDMDELKLYETYGTNSYYRDKYVSYYHDGA